MSKKHDDQEELSEPPLHRVRLPGWLIKEEEVRLGTLVQRVTYRVGIRSCTGCDKRAAVLNHWIALTQR